MKNSHNKNMVKVYSFLRVEAPKIYNLDEIVEAKSIKKTELELALAELIRKAFVIQTSENCFYASHKLLDIKPIMGTKWRKPERKSRSTQAVSWVKVKNSPHRYTQRAKVYSLLCAFHPKSYSRRQIEESLKIRVNSLTSIINQMLNEGELGIEKEAVCEYTGQTVCFYFAIDPKQEPQKKLF